MSEDEDRENENHILVGKELLMVEPGPVNTNQPQPIITHELSIVPGNWRAAVLAVRSERRGV